MVGKVALRPFITLYSSCYQYMDIPVVRVYVVCIHITYTLTIPEQIKPAKSEIDREGEIERESERWKERERERCSKQKKLPKNKTHINDSIFNAIPLFHTGTKIHAK